MWELLGAKAIGIEEPTVTFSDNTFYMSAPFYINNTGFYDLSDLNITIQVINSNKLVARFSKLFPKVPAKSLLSATYDVSLSLEELGSKNKELLTNNTSLDLAVAASLRIAYTIGFGISANTTMEWGAPFNNITISNVNYDSSSHEFNLALSFENDAAFPVNGGLKIDTVNALNETIGSTIQPIDVASGTPFQTYLAIPVDSSKVIGPGVFRVYFLDLLILEAGWS